MKESKPILDFEEHESFLGKQKKEFLLNGKPAEVWFVGGCGTLYSEGNKPIMTQAAFRESIRLWLERAHV